MASSPRRRARPPLLRELGYRTAYFGKWHCGIVRNQVPASVTEDPTGRFEGGSRNRTPE